jgi:hypothetical protein
MPRYQYVILLRAVEGREAEFDRWYADQNIPDVARIDGIVSARLFKVQSQETTGLDVRPWRSLAIYEIEADDPQAVIASIKAVAGTDAMPLSDAMTQSGMVTVIAAPMTLPE